MKKIFVLITVVVFSVIFLSACINDKPPESLLPEGRTTAEPTALPEPTPTPKVDFPFTFASFARSDRQPYLLKEFYISEGETATVDDVVFNALADDLDVEEHVIVGQMALSRESDVEALWRRLNGYLISRYMGTIDVDGFETHEIEGVTASVSRIGKGAPIGLVVDGENRGFIVFSQKDIRAAIQAHQRNTEWIDALLDDVTETTIFVGAKAVAEKIVASGSYDAAASSVSDVVNGKLSARGCALAWRTACRRAGIDACYGETADGIVVCWVNNGDMKQYYDFPGALEGAEDKLGMSEWSFGELKPEAELDIYEYFPR